MPSDTRLGRRLADLWSMLHLGGVQVETRVGGPDTAVVLRTLLQIDGDRVIHIGWRALQDLSPQERTRLADAHHQAVRARSVATLAELRRRFGAVRTLLLALFTGSEVYRGWNDWPILRDVLNPGAWRLLLWQQRWSLALLLAALVGPLLLRWAAPFILRLLARRLIEAHRRQARQASRAVAPDVPPGSATSD